MKGKIKTRKLPFSVSRDDARSLVDQVADGLRQGIVSGYWGVGDEIPSTRELVPLLGVSVIVTKAAIARLAAEGYITARLGMKTIVRDRGEKQWLGNVLFVYHAANVGYFQTAFAEELRTRLNREGYLFTRATISTDDSVRVTDYSLIKAALARKADLAVAFTARRDIYHHLARSGVPYALALQTGELPSGAVGMTRLDDASAMRALAEACRAAGVRRAVSVYWNWKSDGDAVSPFFRDADIAASRLLLKPDTSQGRLLGIERAGVAGFDRLVKSGRLDRDALYFFADDYLARGAITAMFAAGLKAPEDMRLATWSNCGLGPVYLRELSRMEMNPTDAGKTVTKAALEYLHSGRYPANTSVAPRWIEGRTMKQLKGTKP